MIVIIFTDDYEVFGNGSGNIDNCLIKPTEEFLNLCNSYGIPVTLFVDVAEYWAFWEEERKGTLPKDYMPASKIRGQLVEAIKSGHDVQLHLHPQWLNYKYDKQNGWQVDLSLFRLSALPYGDRAEKKSILGALCQGKETLENMLKPHKDDYECIAFRAGGWCIQPESELIKALRDVGIKIDSTVVPGATFDDGVSMYDFREALNVFAGRPFWSVDNNICRHSDDGQIMEIPIFALKTNPVKRILQMIKCKRKGIMGLPKSCGGTYFVSGKSLGFSIMHKLNLLRFRKADLCNMTAEEMYGIVESAFEMEQEKLPMVFSSHSKAMNAVNIRETEKLINLICRNSQVTFGKYSDMIE